MFTLSTLRELKNVFKVLSKITKLVINNIVTLQTAKLADSELHKKHYCISSYFKSKLRYVNKKSV